MENLSTKRQSDEASSTISTIKPKTYYIQDSPDPYDIWKNNKEKSPQRLWTVAKVRAIFLMSFSRGTIILDC